MTHFIRVVLALSLVTSCSTNGNEKQGSASTTTEPAMAKVEPKTSAEKQSEDLATQEVERERNEKQQAEDAKTRATYQTTVEARLAKLDAAIAATKKVPAGLKARRDELAKQIREMPATSGTAWLSYTEGVDASFVKIEHDLRPGN
ncbi:MAG: hypothetical protein WKG01_39270 [Kofleriaceae bacterium]